MILAEITAATDDAGTLQTFYVASGEYRTKPADSPPNRNFINAMADPGNLGVSVYKSGQTGGYGSLEPGTMRLVNSDGRFDQWINYGFDGRSLVLRLYKAGVPHASMPILFTGTIGGPPEIARNNVDLTLRDKAYILEVPVCQRFYGGTNIPPNGVDGMPSDLKGQRKPRCYGHVLNMTPELVNSSLQIFQVHDGAVADIPAVYDKGAPFTKGADYATNALLQAATVSAGSYATCFAEGLFRLNASIAGQVTADVLEGATASDRSAARVAYRLVKIAGVSDDEISMGDLIAFGAAQPTPVGIFVSGDETVRSALNKVIESVGGYAVFDAIGILRMGRLVEPFGDPVLTLTESQAIDITRQAQRDGDLPNHAVVMNHTKNWTLQSSDVAGSVNQDRRNFLKKDFRQAVAEAGSVKVKHPLSPAIEFDSLMVDQANEANGPADVEAKRILALYRTRRDLVEVTVHLDVLRKSGVPSLMSAVRLNVTRPGLPPSKLFWVLGFRLELRRKQAKMLLWG